MEFYTLLIRTATVIFCIYVILRLFNKKLFPLILHLIMVLYGYKKTKAMKLKHFGSLKDIISSDPELRKKNAIRILEVGAGTGVNFVYYPANSRVLAVEPNPNFKSFYKNNKSKFSHIITEEVIQAKGEDMDEVPSESIDVVVMTCVLCTAENVYGVFKQIRRVLVPGGRFYFMEHVKDFDKNNYINRWVQDFLSNSGIWPLLMAGCFVNRNPDSFLVKIKETGFEIKEHYKEYIPILTIFAFLSPYLRGIAIKT